MESTRKTTQEKTRQDKAKDALMQVRRVILGKEKQIEGIFPQDILHTLPVDVGAK